MELIASTIVPRKDGDASIQLLRGNLSEIPAGHKVDILVISAFPDDYRALHGSLMLALKEKGLSVEDLAQDKAADLRATIGCWLSHPLKESLQQRLNFRQILCFEPGTQSDNPDNVVGNIFRCLNTFAFEESNRSIAMPVIASGYQQVPLERMLPALINASLFWLENGLPLDVIKIVVHSQKSVEAAKRIFSACISGEQFINGPQNTGEVFLPPEKPGVSRGIIPLEKAVDSGSESISVSEPQKIDGPLDYFISYAHTQTAPVEHFVNSLVKANPSLNIFYDRSSIPKGGLWIKQISDAIAQAKKVLIFLSADYSASMVCWDEFQCAKVKEYKTRKPVIQTIYLSSDPDLPPMMSIHSYIDCREADLDKLAAACNELLQ